MGSAFSIGGTKYFSQLNVVKRHLHDRSRPRGRDYRPGSCNGPQWHTEEQQGLQSNWRRRQPCGQSESSIASGSRFLSGTISNVTYIGTSQSWAVPYEYPYKAALKAYWRAVIAHYGPNFSIGVTNYFSQLSYFRFGGSVGSEWFPYCTSSLKNLNDPYKYTREASTCPVGHTCTGWLDYYKEMGDYLQSLGPPWRIIHSINTGDNDYTYGDAEADYAVTWSNRYGARDGFGSQGLSSQDVVNCTSPNDCDPGPPNSASDWYPAFAKHAQSGVPLELQPIALSNESNDSCSTTACTPDTNSGDLQQFLPFAVTAGGTDFEIYWRDISLAYDLNNYCALIPGSCANLTSVTLGGQIPDRTQQNHFFQHVGQGGGTYCAGSGYQSGSTGDCSYQNKIDSAQGQH